MLNQIVLVGRLTNEPTIEELESGKKVSNITLAVQRPYKNTEGIYETDLIPITLWQGIAENTISYVHQGDLIGVKGRMQVKDEKLDIVAEKVTFLSSKKGDEE